MGAFAAAVDAVNCISCCFPVFLCWNSKTERRLRVIRRRRRQHLLAVCVLMVLAGGFLKSRVNHNPADNPLRGRRLLHFSLQDNTEILGYILGLLSFVITCTSRFPALHRAHRGRMLTRAHVFSGVLCSLAGALYATAILFYDTQLDFLLTVMPWLLSAICCVTLDPLISPKEVTVSREEVNDQPPKRTVRAIRVDSFCSSDTSYDSSLVSSDLEWDFEVGNAQWSEPKAKQQEGGEFPLQEWPRNPKPFNICTCAMSGLPLNSVTRKEESESGSAANPNDKETSIK
eukprot:superscaffoldBa00004760_g19405